jgi:hypothetical protein
MRTAALALLFVATSAFGEATNCLYPSLGQADNRMVTSHFAGSFNGNSPTYWYAFYGQAQHSYSVEFVATTDNANNNTSIVFGNLYVWGPSDVGSLQQNGCFGPSTVSYYATQGYSPAVAKSKYGTGQRITFTATASGVNMVSVTNSGEQGTYSYRFTDTTLFNARWSTWSGFDTSWGFTNMSDMSITGTLYIYGAGNKLLASPQVTIPPGQQVFRSSHPTDLNLPRNNAGYALFAHNGPPGAILADAYVQNASVTVIVPEKFETRNMQ